MRPLNLATQPFRNETLPAVLIVLAWIVVGLVTVQHAVTIRRLLPARTSAAHRELEALEMEAARQREIARQLRVARPEPAALTQWTRLKELVDRRAFSWTQLFGVLEHALPSGVRLLVITPAVEKGVVTLEFTAAAKSYEQGIELIQVLEDQPEFADVTPLSRGNEDESRFRYKMRYLPPGATPHPGPPPAPAEAGDEDHQARAASLQGAHR